MREEKEREPGNEVDITNVTNVGSLTAFLNSLRIFVERNSSGKEFHTLAPMKDVDFKPKLVDFLRGTTSLLVPLFHIIISFSHYYVR